MGKIFNHINNNVTVTGNINTSIASEKVYFLF